MHPLRRKSPFDHQPVGAMCMHKPDMLARLGLRIAAESTQGLLKGCYRNMS